jgi:ATP-binding cassette subfamily B protein
MAMTEGRRYRDLELYRRLLREARSFWPFIASLLILQLLATPLALLTPVPLKIVVDSVLGTDPLPAWFAPLVPAGIASDSSYLLAYAVTLLVAIAVLEYLRILVVWLMSAYVGNKLLLNFRAKLFGHVQQLSFTYHDSRGSMDSLYRIEHDTASIQQVATDGLIPFIASGVTLAAMVWVTMRIDAWLAVVALCVVPPLFVLTNISRKLIKRQWTSLKAKESSAISIVQETLGALRVVKAFGKEVAARDHFESKLDHVVKDQMRVALTEGSFDLFIAATTALGSAAVLYIGVRHVKSGVITLGDLLLVMG